MPFDAGNFQPKLPDSSDERRIYLGEDGNIRIETRRFPQVFSSDEFVALLRLTLKEVLKEKTANFKIKQ